MKLLEPIFCNFLCYAAAAGPHLVNNRKALILHEQNINHGKIFSPSFTKPFGIHTFYQGGGGGEEEGRSDPSAISKTTAPP